MNGRKPWIFVEAFSVDDLDTKIEQLNVTGELRTFYHLHSLISTPTRLVATFERDEDSV